MTTGIVSELFQQCKRVLQTEASLLGGADTQKALVSVNKILEKLTPRQLGLEEGYGEGSHCAIAQHVCSTNEFAMDIFIIPKSVCLPLHDHPKMTVCTKMLYGTAHFVAYDWINPNSPFPRRAKLSLNDILSGGDPVRMLTPTNANIHSIKSLSTCAFFDILIPPYKYPERNCEYYKPVGEPDSYEIDWNNVKEHLELEQYDPEEFECVGDEYRGPNPLY